MANKRPREKTIKVEAVAGNKPCDMQFNVDVDDLDFSNNADNHPRPGYILYFDLDESDANGLDCKFYAPDPMWVLPFNGAPPPCPTSPAYWDQFKSIDVINEGKTLIVRNRNDYEQKFAFTLRFEVDGCKKVIPTDPIGNNQNGNQ